MPVNFKITGPPECQKCHDRAQIAYSDGYWCRACCPHTAEEIEIYKLKYENYTLSTKVDRFRAALEKISGHYGVVYNGNDDTSGEMRRMAFKALKGDDR